MKLNSDLCWIIGAICGDGSISKGYIDSNRVSFYNTNDLLCKNFIQIIQKEFRTRLKKHNFIPQGYHYKHEIKNRNEINFYIKKLWELLVIELKLPISPKADKIFIPRKILKNNLFLKSFISGLFDTDGGLIGIKKNWFAYCSKSKIIINQLGKIFKKHNISYRIYIINKKYQTIHLKFNNVIDFLNPIILKHPKYFQSQQVG